MNPTFQRLISHLHRGGAWGYFWEDRRKSSLWWPAGDPAQIPTAWAGRNVYFGVNPSTVKRGDKRATNETIAALNCVFAEFDAKDLVQPNEYTPHLPNDFEHLNAKRKAAAVKLAKEIEAARLTVYKDRALAHILALSAQPSAIVDSGGGYHCYWLIDEPFQIDNDEARTLAQSVQYAWIDLVASDGGAKDLARVLRVPGQMNHKYEPARPVEFVRADFDLLYTWSTIFELTADVLATKTEHSKPVQTTHNERRAPVCIDDAELIEKAKRAPKFAGLWAGDWSDYDSQSSADLALANILVWWTNHDLARVDRLFRSSGLMRPKWDQSHRADGATYGQMTLERANAIDGGYTGQTTPTPTAMPVSLLTQHIESLTSSPLVVGYTSGAAAIEVDQGTGEILYPDSIEFEPSPADLIRAEINELIDWSKSTSFEPFVPLELQSSVGYRTDGTDTRVAVALLTVAHERATFTPLISLRDLARRAGVGSHQTVIKALERLAGWFCTRHEDGVIDVARRSTTDTHCDESKMHMVDLRATYAERLTDDVFLTGYSRTKRIEATEEARRRGVKSVGQIVCYETHKIIMDDLPVVVIETVEDDITSWRVEVQGHPFTAEQMVGNGYDVRILEPWQVVMRDYLAGLGEAVLRIVDAIEVHGAMTKSEIVESTGKTKSAVGRATLKAERAGLLTVEQDHKRAPKVYSLNEDWREIVEDLRPKAKTYMLTTEREVRDCTERIAYADRLLSSPKTEEAQRRRLENRRARAQRRWAELMAVLRPEVDPSLWSTAPVQMTRSFMDWSPIMQERRQERTVRDMQTVSDLMQPNRLLWRRDLAQLRTAAGRLGVKLETYDGLAYAAD